MGQLDALVCPADAASFPTSICGYPVVTVPAGVVRGQPHGVGFIGTAWSEGTLLRLAYSFEQATRAIVRPAFRMRLDEPEPAVSLPPASPASPAEGGCPNHAAGEALCRASPPNLWLRAGALPFVGEAFFLFLKKEFKDEIDTAMKVQRE